MIIGRVEYRAFAPVPSTLNNRAVPMEDPNAQMMVGNNAHYFISSFDQNN